MSDANGTWPAIGEVFRILRSRYGYSLCLVATTSTIHNGLGCLCWKLDYNNELEEKYIWAIAIEPDMVEPDTYEY